MIKQLSLISFTLLLACSSPDPSQTEQKPGNGAVVDEPVVPVQPATEARLVTYTEEREACDHYTEERLPLFGDLHVHTALSFDAVANNIGTDPVDAYRFAKGEAIPYFPVNDSGVAEGVVQIDRPLDFLSVTDHAEFLGEWYLCRNPDSAVYNGTFCKNYRLDTWTGTLMLASIIDRDALPSRYTSVCGEDGSGCLDAMGTPWSRMINAAEEAYDRSAGCTFTSLHGYEWTAGRNGSNIHRNVIFRNAWVPARPISYVEAPTDLELWQQMGDSCGSIEGCDFIAIPHNSNLSNGRLLTPHANIGLENLSPEEERIYAELRLEREPVMEIFQHKGQSECVNGLHSVLGAPDELCDIEQVRILGENNTFSNFNVIDNELAFGPELTVTTDECYDTGKFGMYGAGCIHRNDFLRGALLTGLEGERDLNINTAKYGVIASTDTHGSTPGAVAEDNWHGHVNGETTIQERLRKSLLASGIRGNPGGLAGVWSVENSRDAIFEAIKRKETFGTSGPRITPRFFAGFNYSEDLCGSTDMVSTAYAEGVPMGGTLDNPDNDTALRFIAQAIKDPLDGAVPLAKLQIIKGWLDNEGRAHNRVHDIAVDESGSSELCTVFTDPEFDPDQHAYYYLRVVSTPTPRWSAYDCEKLPESERPAVCTDGSYPVEIREMAWTSPVWYQP